jgi:hypothetical protein
MEVHTEAFWSWLFPQSFQILEQRPYRGPRWSCELARIDRTGRGPGLHAARDEWALFSAPLFGRPRAGAAAPVPVPPLALSVSVTLCVTLPRLARSRPKPPGSL